MIHRASGLPVLHTGTWQKQVPNWRLTGVLQQIESHGATVEEIPLPPWTGNLADWHHQVMAFEAARARRMNIAHI